jgi:cytochrome c oxidase cbb3-type subunit 3
MRSLLIILIAFAPLVRAQDPDEAAQAQSMSAAVAAGKRIFQQNCGFCHGPDARGASGPDLLRSALVNRDNNGNLIGEVVRNGRREKGMPAFQLSEADIKSIAEFLHNAIKTAASVAQRIPSEYPLQKLLVGNAGQGEAYFETHCTHCHSVSSDLAHIAAKYKPFDLQTRIVFPSGLKPALTVRDKSGAVYRGEQAYADEFLVTLRDKNGSLHTWQRKNVHIEVSDPLAAHERLLETYTDKDIHNLFAYMETLK